MKNFSQESNDCVVYSVRGMNFGPFGVFWVVHSSVLHGRDWGEAFQLHFQGIGCENSESHFGQHAVRIISGSIEQSAYAVRIFLGIAISESCTEIPDRPRVACIRVKVVARINCMPSRILLDTERLT